MKSNGVRARPTSRRDALEAHLEALKQCSRCPEMIPPVVTHRPVAGKIYLCGQAPGRYEGEAGKPFAWTAGKTLFRWFSSIKVDEKTFRSRAYMGAVCRCYPGKAKAGGDRVPSPAEISNCGSWMAAEFALLQPELVIPVGKLAVEQFLPGRKLSDVVGTIFATDAFGVSLDIICLPHPSGASTWFKVEPGRTLLAQALELLSRHPAWTSTFPSE